MVDKIRLIPDKYHLTDVGQLDNGNNYWIDVQLIPEKRDTHDFVATYIFDGSGTLIDSKINYLGLRSDPDAFRVKDIIAQERSRIGVRKSGFFGSKSKSFWVKPFSVRAHDVDFGLVVREPEADDPARPPVVDAMPGWTLMFYPPWEDGGYDT